MKKFSSILLLVVLVTVSFRSSAFFGGGKIVMDPWNLVKTTLTSEQMIKQVALSADQLLQLEGIFTQTVQVLAESVWIHSAVMGQVSIEQQVLRYFRNQFQYWLALNVPAGYRGLFNEIVFGTINEYLRDRREVYPLMRANQFDPYSPGSARGQHYANKQKIYDVSHATAQLDYDESSKKIEDMAGMHNYLNQPTIGGSAQLANQIAIMRGVNEENFRRSYSIHQQREAYRASEDLEAQRRWLQFLGHVP